MEASSETDYFLIDVEVLIDWFWKTNYIRSFDAVGAI